MAAARRSNATRRSRRPAAARRAGMAGDTRRKALLATAGAAGAGALGVALASSVGVGELVAGGFVAYVAYRVIRYGVAWTEALIEGVELEHGEVPRKASNVAA